MSTIELIAMLVFFLCSIGYYFFHQGSFDQSGLKHPKLSGLVSVFLFTLFAIGAIIAIHYYVSPLPDRLTDQNPIWQIIIISAFPQELFFRGTLLPLLQKKLSSMTSLLISSAIFSLIHIFIPNISMVTTSIILLLTFFGWLFWWRHMLHHKNLYYLILSHGAILITFNLLT